MALALYRKYRPCSFAELIGQDHVTEPLMQALRSGRLNHAYLFSGPRGCGKTSSARILARSLNCEQGPTPQPCGDCESCRALAPDGPGSIDVIEIDAASHGGVDDARELRERAFFAPAVSRYKIYIIDEAHMVSSAGFNALLKLVEEPPDYVKFVFATTEPEKVLGTIKSRTHHYPFRLIPPGVLRPYLEDLCAREGVAVEPGVVPLVVRAGGGSARDSLSVLDQLIAGAGADGVTYAGAVALLGVTDASLIDEACDALAAGDGAGAFVAIERVAEAGLDPRRFAGDLLERLRDLILLRQVPDAAGRGLIDAPADQLERMQAHVAHLGPATLSRWADIVHNGLVEMRGTASPRLLLELIVARMLLPAVDDSSASLLSRLEQLEQGRSAGRVFPGSPGPQEGSEAKPVPGGGREAARAAAAAAAQGGSGASGQARVATPSAASDTGDLDADGVATTLVARDSPEAGGGPMPVQSRDSGGSPGRRAAVGGDMPIPAAHEPGEGENMDAARVRRAWNEILSLLGRGNKRMAAMARDAVVREVEGRTLVLVFAHSFHLNSINNDHSALLATVSQVLGGTWQLRCELGGDQKSAGVDKPKPSGSSTARATTADGADGWPAPAPIGGVGTARSQATPGPAQTAAAPKAAAGRQAARAAAKPSGTATTRSRGGAPRLAVPSDDGGPPEEPPYDPEFDGPPGVYDGFAPGDEPTEEIMDPVVARRDSQQQAVEVVKQMFAGAETIGEVDAR